MRYLCLGYYDPQRTAARPKGEIEAVMRRVGGSVQVTDGPFAEAKEIVGAAFLIEAGDMEEAVRLASLHPTTRVPVGEELGWRLEIRPIDYFQKGDVGA